MSDRPVTSASLPLAQERHLNDVCRRFESAWKSAADRCARPSIEAYLADTTDPLRSHCLHELVLMDAYYRRLHGEEPRLEDYQRRFPDLPPRLQQEFAAQGDTPRDPRAGQRRGPGGVAERARLRHPGGARPRRHGGRLPGAAL